MCKMYSIIEQLCNERKIKPGKLCSDLKISRGIISDLKTGRTKKLSAENLDKVASYFGVTTDYLIGKSKFRNAHEMVDYWGAMGPYFEANFDFGELVKQERQKLGLTIDDMAEFLGITPQDAHDCEDGVLPINREMADQMAFFLGTEVSQMLFDNNLYPAEVPEEYHDRVAEWERLCQAANKEAARDVISANSQRPLPSNIIPMPKTYKVPLVGTIACGQPILAVEEADEIVEVPEYIDADFALRCKGDSMVNARIFDGDIVYIHSQPEVENGQIAAVRIGEEATLKKVYYNGQRLILRAANPLYGDLEYEGPVLDEVEVLGKAVAFTSMLPS